MARYGEAKEEPRAPRDDKPYWGFDAAGAMFRSAVPVDNAITRIAKEVVGYLRNDLWTPADVVLDLTRKPEFFRIAFGYDEAAQWSTLDQYYQWAGSCYGSSLVAFIRNRGREKPPWTEDENAWAAECDRWERQDAGRPSRFAHATERLEVLERYFGGEQLAVARRVMDEAQRGAR